MSTNVLAIYECRGSGKTNSKKFGFRVNISAITELEQVSKAVQDYEERSSRVEVGIRLYYLNPEEFSPRIEGLSIEDWKREEIKGGSCWIALVIGLGHISVDHLQNADVLWNISKDLALKVFESAFSNSRISLIRSGDNAEVRIFPIPGF